MAEPCVLYGRALVLYGRALVLYGRALCTVWRGLVLSDSQGLDSVWRRFVSVWQRLLVAIGIPSSIHKSFYD